MCDEQLDSESSGATSRMYASSTDAHVDCAVIIVTYNSARYITDLIRSLSPAAPEITLRIVVVDNASTDATVRLVRSFGGVTCIETGVNLGYAGGINVGRKHVGACSALLILNPDAVVEPAALGHMFAALADPAIGIVAPMLIDQRGHRYPSQRRRPTVPRAIGDALLGANLRSRPGWLTEMVWDEDSYSYCHSIDWATGAVLLISDACDQAVGEWDESFFLYSEETDYAARAHALGFQAVYVPSARVLHSGGGSSQSSDLIALRAVSRVKYMEKHGHWPRLYRMVIIAGELLRVHSPAHRTALTVLIRRSRWLSLITGLKTFPTATIETCSDLTPSNP